MKALKQLLFGHRVAGLGIIAVVTLMQRGYATEITFKNHATVSSPFITLGDIANIDKTDEARQQQLAATQIAPSPSPGTKTYLDFATIRARLIAVGAYKPHMQFGGASRTEVDRQVDRDSTVIAQTGQNRTIKRPANPLDKRSLEAKLEQQIRMQLANLISPKELQATEIQLQIDWQSAPRWSTSEWESLKITGWRRPLSIPQTLLIETANPNAQPIRMFLGCRLSFPEKVPMATRRIAPGTQLKDTDIYWDYQQKIQGELVTEVIGLETTRSLQPGQIIRAKDLRKKPYVRQQDVVTAISRVNGISVSTTMKSLSTGGLGETVNLSSLDNRTKFVGRVVGTHQVEILSAK